MAEEVKNIRLSKFAKEFNVGVPSLVECLTKNGFQVESSPNTKLTPEQYDLLAAQGIAADLTLHPGNHFVNADGRMVAAFVKATELADR